MAWIEAEVGRSSFLFCMSPAAKQFVSAWSPSGRALFRCAPPCCNQESHIFSYLIDSQEGQTPTKRERSYRRENHVNQNYVTSSVRLENNTVERSKGTTCASSNPDWFPCVARSRFINQSCLLACVQVRDSKSAEACTMLCSSQKINRHTCCWESTSARLHQLLGPTPTHRRPKS